MTDSGLVVAYDSTHYHSNNTGLLQDTPDASFSCTLKRWHLFGLAYLSPQPFALLSDRVTTRLFHEDGNPLRRDQIRRHCMQRGYRPPPGCINLRSSRVAACANQTLKCVFYYGVTGGIGSSAVVLVDCTLQFPRDS
jgi:hypothetical protein